MEIFILLGVIASLLGISQRAHFEEALGRFYARHPEAWYTVDEQVLREALVIPLGDRQIGLDAALERTYEKHWRSLDKLPPTDAARAIATILAAGVERATSRIVAGTTDDVTRQIQRELGEGHRVTTQPH